MSKLCRGPLLLAMLAAAPTLFAATAPATPRDGVEVLAPPKALSIDPAADRLVAQGGELAIRWNDELLRDLGMPRRGAAPGPDVTLRVPLSKATRLEADVVGQSLRPFAAGGGELQGAFQFELRDGATIAWRQPKFVVRPGENLRFDFASADGAVLFYGDHLMYGLSPDGAEVQLRSFDLRIAPALAERLGQPSLAGLAVAEVRGRMPVASRIDAATPKACGDPNWPGEPVPGVPGATYQADVFTTNFSAQVSRCRRSVAVNGCDGPGGDTDGEIVFTPSSTLRNNMSQGTPVAVVPGDPLGTSTSVHSADVEWETKFTNNVAGPYPQTDQHPFLIWNLYRIDANGAITQVGRSGVKHAWLTINVGTGCESCNGGHVLGRACSDTYGTGNNDNPSDLGPRREIIPATGQWGRCRSIYDTNCDGVQNAGGNGNYDQRMVVAESAVDPAANPGASWLFESWYIVRDDINIHNTMATQPFAASWNGSVWQTTNTTSSYRLGSAVARWVASAPAGSVARLGSLDAPEGEAQLGLRVTDLGNGTWRYEYALMNLDFARAVTAGAEPNLQVIRNNGFNRFSVRFGDGVNVSTIGYTDGDPSRADWIATQSSGAIEWVAPDDAASQNWGVMARFGFVADAAPVEAVATLGVTEIGANASYDVATLKAGGAAVPGAPDLLNDTGRSNSDNITNVLAPVFEGPCKNGDAIQLSSGSNDLGVPTVCSNSSFTITVAGLAEGSYSLVARGSLGSDVSAPSAALPVVVDRTAPAAPMITGPATTPSVTATVIGTGGEAFAELSLFDGAQIVCTTIVASTGSWSCNATLAGPGLRTLFARQIDAAGNVSANSAMFDIEVSGSIFLNGFESPIGP